MVRITSHRQVNVNQIHIRPEKPQKIKLSLSPFTQTSAPLLPPPPPPLHSLLLSSGGLLLSVEGHGWTDQKKRRGIEQGEGKICLNAMERGTHSHRVK